MSFVHLHVHSEYSWLDGACYTEKLLDLAVKHEMPAVAITDRNSIAGAFHFSEKAKKLGIKAIIGLDIEVLNDISDGRAFSVILLAKDFAGFNNLNRLITLAYEYDTLKPKITKSQLQKHSHGLICLSFSVVGELCTLLLEDREEETLQVSNWYAGIFGEDYYYEIHNHGLPKEAIAMNKLLDLAGQSKIPLVAANDCHYLQASDSIAIDALNSIRSDLDFTHSEAKRFACNEYYFKSPVEMASMFHFSHQLISNSLKIADKIELDLTNLYLCKIDKENHNKIEKIIDDYSLEMNLKFTSSDLQLQLSLPKEEIQDFITYLTSNLTNYFLSPSTEYIPWTSQEINSAVLRVLGQKQDDITELYSHSSNKNHLFSQAQQIAEKLANTWKKSYQSSNTFVFIPENISLPLVTDSKGNKRCQFNLEILNKMGFLTIEISELQ